MLFLLFCGGEAMRVADRDMQYAPTLTHAHKSLDLLFAVRALFEKITFLTWRFLVIRIPIWVLKKKPDCKSLIFSRVLNLIEVSGGFEPP